MLSAFIAGMIVGAFLSWKISRWWRKSPIKKASDAVGTAAQGPTQVAKGLYRKAKGFIDDALKNKDPKDDKEEE